MSVGRGWAQIEADLRAELAAIGVTQVHEGRGESVEPRRAGHLRPC